jgi:hypothetical protein
MDLHRRATTQASSCPIIDTPSAWPSVTSECGHAMKIVSTQSSRSSLPANDNTPSKRREEAKMATRVGQVDSVMMGATQHAGLREERRERPRARTFYLCLGSVAKKPQVSVLDLTRQCQWLSRNVRLGSFTSFRRGLRCVRFAPSC